MALSHLDVEVDDEQPETLAADTSTAGLPGEWAFTAAFALFGLIIGIGQLSDNSLLTHLTTGRYIVDHFGVPREDLYTFTSAGEPWIVQSWFASFLYGAIDAVAGGFGLRVFFGLTTSLLGAAVWRLSRPATTLIPRILLSGSTLALGIVMWSQRPLLIGLLGFAVVLLLVEQSDRDLRWLVPVMWVWVNSHGSYPLALVLLGALAVGSLLDGETPHRTIEAAKWTAVGTLLGGIVNPYGPKMLLFPMQLLGRSETLQYVNEWKSPVFTELYARIFLGLTIVTVLAIVRGARMRAAVPVALFLAAALVGVRNLSLASIVFVAAAAPALADLGSLRVSPRSRKARAVIVASAAGAFMTLLIASQMQDVNDTSYPVAAIDFLDEHDAVLGERIFHADRTGNYLGYRYGTDAQVFIDDRFELHAPELVADYLAVIRGTGRWDTVLDEYGINIVVFGVEGPFPQLLETDDAWRVVYRDPDVPESLSPQSFVACRVSAGICSTLSS